MAQVVKASTSNDLSVVSNPEPNLDSVLLVIICKNGIRHDKLEVLNTVGQPTGLIGACHGELGLLVICST